MQRIFTLIPLAAIEVIGIFREAGRFHNSKITAVRNGSASTHRTTSGSIPRSWLSKIIKSGPYKFSRNIITGHRIIQRIMRCHSPAYCRCIIRSQMIFPICVGRACLAGVYTTAVHCGRCFRRNNHTAISTGH